jgi:hypothetical protein
MVFDWLQEFRTGWWSESRRLRQPRQSQPVQRPIPAWVQVLEPRTLLSATPLGPEFQVNSLAQDQQTEPFAAMDANGDFIAIDPSRPNSEGSGYGASGQQFEIASVSTPPTVTNVVVASDPLEPGEQLVAPPAALVLQFSENMATTGGTSGPASITTPANWSLLRNGNDLSGQIGGITFGFNAAAGRHEAVVTFTAALSPGDYTLTLHDAVVDLEGNALDGDGNGAAGGDFVRAIRVRTPQPMGPAVLVNTFTSNSQQLPAVAMDADGDFVVTWTSYFQQDTVGDVYAQRFLANGAPAGGEFRVNTTTHAQQRYSAVAMDENGDFVITWSGGSYGGSGYGVFAQRYLADGTPQGTEFLVNAATTGNQFDTTIAMGPNGDFVIAWTSHNTGDFDVDGIYARRFAADGTPQGGDIHVNSTIPSVGAQQMPAIAMDGVGNFVIAWTSSNEDGSAGGIYAQRYAANGTPQGNQFLVNTFTTENQLEPTVAMDRDGDFAIAWMSNRDGDSYGIYAQRYAANGTTRGGEFRVNSATAGRQFEPQAAMDADGDLIIGWGSTNQSGPGTGSYLQRYAADGSALGANILVLSAGQRPAVGMDRDGDFVIAASGNFIQDGGADVLARRYAGGESPTGITLSSLAVAENLPIGFTIGTLDATDANSPESFAYALVAGSGSADNASFSIQGNVLRTAANFNYEAQSSYSLRVQVTDAGGLTFEKQFSLGVTDINEIPTAVLFQNVVSSLPENANTAGNVKVADIVVTDDALGTNVPWLGGVDAAAFEIVGTELFLKAGTVLNFEAKPSYAVSVYVNDPTVGTSPDAGADFELALTNVNEVPVIGPQTYALPTRSRAGTVVGTVAAADPDLGQALNWTIQSGNTSNAFSINASTGQIVVNNARAVKTPKTFALVVRATDNGTPTLFGQATVTINVARNVATKAPEPQPMSPPVQPLDRQTNESQAGVAGTSQPAQTTKPSDQSTTSTVPKHKSDQTASSQAAPGLARWLLAFGKKSKAKNSVVRR